MEDATTSDRDALLAFELALDEKVCDEVHRESWGRLFLTRSAPLIWDANWVGIEAVGMSVEQVVAIGDDALGGEGMGHRTICPLDQADGQRIAREIEAEAARWPRWEVERTRYMLWRGGRVEAPEVAREVRSSEIEALRRAIIAEVSVPRGVEQPEATVEQLLELERRYGEAAGDRWFVAPAEGEPASACRLLRQGRVGQVEDVGTLAHARERGWAKATVLAAIAASQAAGDETIFLTADAADWPQLFYSRLGFETVGDLTVLRRRP
ncbi:MAG TPA: GNAT family N-acetyltransferase [Solirubrobacterales bacterium]|jgi:ribosomal protein S18 acetylase RimI-like enzyme